MVDEVKYNSKLKQDAGVILLVLGLLYFSELFIFYRIISTIWGTVDGLATIFPFYLLFLVLLLGIETIGCVQVYKSIKEHMFDFEYYD